jgi:hypothetical protein
MNHVRGNYSVNQKTIPYQLGIILFKIGLVYAMEDFQDSYNGCKSCKGCKGWMNLILSNQSTQSTKVNI